MTDQFLGMLRPKEHLPDGRRRYIIMGVLVTDKALADKDMLVKGSEDLLLFAIQGMSKRPPKQLDGGADDVLTNLKYL